MMDTTSAVSPAPSSPPHESNTTLSSSSRSSEGSEISQLSMCCARKGLPQPTYTNMLQEGPSHKPSFRCTVTVNQQEFIGEKWEQSAQSARNEVSRVALKSLGWNSELPGVVASLNISKLHELCQKNGYGNPVFELIERSGPEHRPLFRFRVNVKGKWFVGEQTMNTTQLAKSEAARVALEGLAVSVTSTPTKSVPPRPPTPTTRRSSVPLVVPPLPVVNSHSMTPIPSLVRAPTPPLPPPPPTPVTSPMNRTSLVEPTSAPLDMVQNRTPLLLQFLQTSSVSVTSEASAPTTSSPATAVHLSQLNEECQRWNWGTPIYEVIERSGPDHSPLFRCRVKVKGKTFEGVRTVNTVKLAKAEAAKVALENLTGIKSTPRIITQGSLINAGTGPSALLTPVVTPTRVGSHLVTPLTSETKEQNHAAPLPTPPLQPFASLVIGPQQQLSASAQTTVSAISDLSRTGFSVQDSSVDVTMPMDIDIKMPETVQKPGPSIKAASTTLVVQSTNVEELDPLVILNKVCMEKVASSPSYARLLSPHGFKFEVTLDGKVLATSAMFISEVSAKRHAAELALSEITKGAVEFVGDATENGTVDGADLGLKLKGINLLLSEFSGSLSPTKQIKMVTAEILIEISLILKDDAISGFVVGGSYGRCTAIVFDYDIEFVLLSKTISPDDLIELMQEKVKEHPHVFSFAETRMEGKQKVLRIAYAGRQTLFCRVLAATDLVETEELLDRETIQQSLVLQKLKELSADVNSIDVDTWSVAACESSHVFMRNHSYASDLSRLVKCWYSCQPVVKEIDNIYLILDLLSIYAFDKLEEQNNYDRSKMCLLTAFQNILKLLGNWKALRVFWTENYPRSTIPTYFLSSASPPLLLDPCNPFRNLITAEGYEAWDDSASLAWATSNKLSHAKYKNDLAPSNVLTQMFLPKTLDFFGVKSFSYKLAMVVPREPIPYKIPFVEPITDETVDPQQAALLYRIGRLIIAQVHLASRGMPTLDRDVSVGKATVEATCTKVLSSVKGNIADAKEEGSLTFYLHYPVQNRWRAAIMMNSNPNAFTAGSSTTPTPSPAHEHMHTRPSSSTSIPSPEGSEISQLSMCCARKGLPQPIYTNMTQVGPQHNPTFICAVYVNHQEFTGENWEQSAQSARNEAARVALKNLGWEWDLPGVVSSLNISKLHDVAQKTGWGNPLFELVERNGPDHRPWFRHRVNVNGRWFDGEKMANTVQLSKAEAARVALEGLRVNGPSTPTSKTPPTSTPPSPNGPLITTPRQPASSASPISVVRDQLPSPATPTLIPTPSLARTPTPPSTLINKAPLIQPTPSPSTGQVFEGVRKVSSVKLARAEAAKVALENLMGKKSAVKIGSTSTFGKGQALFSTAAILAATPTVAAPFSLAAQAKTLPLKPTTTPITPATSTVSSASQQQITPFKPTSTPTSEEKPPVVVTESKKSENDANAEVSATPTPTSNIKSPESVQEPDANKEDSVKRPITAASEQSIYDNIININNIEIDLFPALNKVCYEKFAASPSYVKLNSAKGVQFQVLINGRLIATSGTFLTDMTAKRHAAELALVKIEKGGGEKNKVGGLVGGSGVGGKVEVASSVSDKGFSGKVDTGSPALDIGVRGDNDKGGSPIGDSAVSATVEAGSGVSQIGVGGKSEKGSLLGDSGVDKKVEVLDSGFDGINKVLSLIFKDEEVMSRVVIGGSYGRNTPVVFDFDIEIILLTKTKSPSELIATMKEKVKSDKSFTYVKTRMEGKQAVMSFSFGGLQTLHCKVLVGTDLVEAEEVVDRETLQQSLVLKKLQELSTGDIASANVESWSISASESSRVFMKNHDYASELSRLVKCWYCCKGATKTIDHLYLIFDLLSIYAFDKMEEQNNYDKSKLSLLTAFQNVLQLIGNWKKLRIFWTENYPRSSIPSFLLSSASPPLLLDPCNPLRNLISAKVYEGWDELASMALGTFNNLNQRKEESQLTSSNILSQMFPVTTVDSLGVKFFSYRIALVVPKDEIPHKIPFVELINHDNMDPKHATLLHRVGRIIIAQIHLAAKHIPTLDENLDRAKSVVEVTCKKNRFMGMITLFVEF
ncbi:hypothetical protein HDU76_008520 [Blyttiomyces sp. JEL0837]|nr:hypothetical protein HDU76_008520 [Blyttiomyces sp. JEL0837]